MDIYPQHTNIAQGNLHKPLVSGSLPLECEIRTPIEDALYATGKFTTDECTYLAEGILQYLADAKMKVVWQ